MLLPQSSSTIVLACALLIENCESGDWVVLTVLTALPWEASIFTQGLQHRTDLKFGSGWISSGYHRGIQVRVLVSGPGIKQFSATRSAIKTLNPPTSKLLATGVGGGLQKKLRTRNRSTSRNTPKAKL